MNRVRNLIRAIELAILAGFALPRRQEGQTLVEYAVILVFIALVVIATVSTLGARVKTLFSNVASSI